MSESLTPLEWKPDGAPVEGEPASKSTASSSFSWPTPPYASYPAPTELRSAQPCEIEGLNGKILRGRLLGFMPDERRVQVQIPPARTTMLLRFDQFRSITLSDTVAPQEDFTDSVGRETLGLRPRSLYRLRTRDGRDLEGDTIGHFEEPFGVFLFPPADDADRVQRLFVPRSAIASFEFGSRIGELLVESRAATADAVQSAAVEQQRLRQQKLGDILIIKRAVTPEQLLLALEQQSRMPMVRIGEALVGLELITPRQLEAALASQREDRSAPIGEILVRLGLVSRDDLQVALARKMGYPIVDLKHFPIDTEALRKVNASVAKRLKALPLMHRGASLVVAIGDPSRRSALDELEFVAQCKIVPVLAQHAEIDEALRVSYQKIGAEAFGPGGPAAAPDGIEFDAEDAGKLVESLEREQSDRLRVDDDRPIEQSDNSLVRLINQMIVEAHADGVSDIHIECHPGREKVRIRFRKDGVLRPYLELPHNYRSAVVARIKIMCDLDISERRKPQDGKINFARFSSQHRLELRVATIPTHSGLEDVVLRLLGAAKPLPLDRIGLSPRNLEALKTAVERPYGLVLCVGPTGSGKTTTLHSAISHINVPERKIWTAEDPIEITQPGLRQVQVNPKIEWTFAKALRAFLRADPDVIMVGEIRDAETGQMAIEASLTGHLVLSTLHTNSAPETVTRLLDMGMDPFNFADSLLGVLGQRLVRRLCPHCRQSRAANEAEIEVLLEDWLHCRPEGSRDDPTQTREALRAHWAQTYGRDGRIVSHASAGCAKCQQTGHIGRIAIHELMVVTPEIRRLIQTRAGASALQRVAIDGGMRTLRQDGLEKVLAGLTSIEEVRATSNA
jgi:type II secretory ATPase GspE/PulE/Tfp pilus assembly ATPase PilB-like protein